MMHLESAVIECPYCGVQLTIDIDPSVGDQCYIEDCQVCCAPIELSVTFEAAGAPARVVTRRDDE